VRRRPDATTAKVLADHRTYTGQQPPGAVALVAEQPLTLARSLRVNLDSAGSIARHGGLQNNAPASRCAGRAQSRSEADFHNRPISSAQLRPPRAIALLPRALPRAIAMATSESPARLTGGRALCDERTRRRPSRPDDRNARQQACASRSTTGRLRQEKG
jgi:hypothetical protein